MIYKSVHAFSNYLVRLLEQFLFADLIGFVSPAVKPVEKLMGELNLSLIELIKKMNHEVFVSACDV